MSVCGGGGTVLFFEGEAIRHNPKKQQVSRLRRTLTHVVEFLPLRILISMLFFFGGRKALLTVKGNEC